MDQETSNKFAKDGALFILQGLPLQSEFGIDCKSYQIGEKFKGLKMIPKGKSHMVQFGANNKLLNSANLKLSTSQASISYTSASSQRMAK